MHASLLPAATHLQSCHLWMVNIAISRSWILFLFNLLAFCQWVSCKIYEVTLALGHVFLYRWQILVNMWKLSSLCINYELKWKFTPKSKIPISPLTCSAIYSSRLFWCGLSSFGDSDHRDFCLLSNIMEWNGALIVVHKEIHSNVSFHDPVTQNNPQALVWLSDKYMNIYIYVYMSAYIIIYSQGKLVSVMSFWRSYFTVFTIFMLL